jgi:hypothetical protein
MITIIPRDIMPNSGSWYAMDDIFVGVRNFDGVRIDTTRKIPMHMKNKDPSFGFLLNQLIMRSIPPCSARYN